MKTIWIGAAAALSLLAAGPASAATEHFSATLKGSEETPANTTTGTGKVDAVLDTGTRAFAYTVNYSGLTGPATAAHFHKGAAGVAGPPVLPVPKEVVAHNPMKGHAQLTADQVKDLEAGLWYFNIHTAANPGGEIRGQVTKAK